MTDLSIIICTYNRPDMAAQTVAQVLGQDFTDFEILLIDQSAPAASATLQARLGAECNDPRVHYQHSARPSLTHARNLGLLRAQGRIVLFLDDDVLLLGRDFLDAHMNCYADAKVGGVSGRVIERSNRPNTKHTACAVSRGGRTLDNLTGFERTRLQTLKGLNMSYRAEVFAKLGGFDRNYTGTCLLEEADMSTRVAQAGWVLLFEPAAEVVHLSNKTGGVRVENAVAGEASRFRCTAYFITKNRGLAALPPFVATFTLIAILRAFRWSRPSALPTLARAAWDGVRLARRGHDHAIDGSNATLESPKHSAVFATPAAAA